MGGSSGGGGGGSGAVSWPNYIQEAHYGILSREGLDAVSLSVIGAVNAALSNDPYSGETAFDPSYDLIFIEDALNNFEADIGLWNPYTSWTSIVDVVNAKLDGVFSEDVITDARDAYADSMQDELDDDILPKYRVGMRDLNMINTSAFAIGEALIYGKKLKEVAKFEADLRLKNAASRWEGLFRSVDRVTENELNKYKFKQSLVGMITEGTRLTIVASKEYVDKQLEIDAASARWDMESFQYAANVIAAPSGGTSTPQARPTSMQSAIGGALSGAAMGGMIAGASNGAITGPWGMAAGAAIGLGASFL